MAPATVLTSRAIQCREFSIDGVFAHDGEGLRFRPAHRLTRDEVSGVVAFVAQRIDRLLWRLGLATTRKESEAVEIWADEAPVLAGLADASARRCAPGQTPLSRDDRGQLLLLSRQRRRGVVPQHQGSDDPVHGDQWHERCGRGEVRDDARHRESSRRLLCEIGKHREVRVGLPTSPRCDPLDGSEPVARDTARSLDAKDAVSVEELNGRLLDLQSVAQGDQSGLANILEARAAADLRRQSLADRQFSSWSRMVPTPCC